MLREKRSEKMIIDEVLKKPYWHEMETAFVTGRSVFTLRNDRSQRRGFQYHRIGRRGILYKRDEVIAEIESRKISFG